MIFHHKIHVDSRCRDPGAYANGNSFRVDLARPLFNVKKINVVKCAIPVYPSADWQAQHKSASIVLNGFRSDIAQALPNQCYSGTAAIVPLVDSNDTSVAWTFYDAKDDADLWRCPTQVDLNVPRLDSLHMKLITYNPLTGIVVGYPFPDDGYAMNDNWTLTLEIVCMLG